MIDQIQCPWECCYAAMLYCYICFTAFDNTAAACKSTINDPTIP